jgi:hypothetical protein
MEVVNDQPLASGKGAAGDRRSEVSRTAKTCTDEQSLSRLAGNCIRGIVQGVRQHNMSKPES